MSSHTTETKQDARRRCGGHRAVHAHRAALPVVGGVLMFLLAFIAISMA